MRNADGARARHERLVQLLPEVPAAAEDDALVKVPAVCSTLRVYERTHSVSCYHRWMTDRGELLRRVMTETGTGQGELSRLSGVHQPSISQFLSGRVDLSDEQLGRLLSCMGRRLRVVRDVIEPELTRSERRSWLLHRKVSSQLTPDTLRVWEPTIVGNVRRLRDGVTGQPHTRNLERWQHLVKCGDILGLKRVLTGLDRESIEMREVSPMRGVLTEQDRLDVLARAI